MRDEKASLRRTVAERLGALTPEEFADRGARARQRLMLTDEFIRARSFLLYASLPDEIDTAPLIDELLNAGRSVFLPVCRPERRDLDIVPIRDRGADLVRGHFGIAEPRPGLAVGWSDEIEFLLVPGRAFDRQGRRLGRGGGYYDRCLPRLGATATRAALALDCQVVPRVPADAHDQRVGLIVTELEVIRP